MKRMIKNGIYLVVDPAMPLMELLPLLERVLKAGVSTIQVWDHFPPECDAVKYTQAIMGVAAQFHVPVLINENWSLFLQAGADGIHFDRVPDQPDELWKQAGPDRIIGITCGNDRERVKWAAENNVDYISFCSMFPSSSAGTCELVNPANVQRAREIFRGKIFLSGGITPMNMANLAPLKMDGIAVISGILSVADPERATRNYLNMLEQHAVTIL